MYYLMSFILVCLSVGCQNTHPLSSSDDYANVWPIDRQSLWLKEETRVALMAKDWDVFLVSAETYHSPYRELLQVEAYHAMRKLDLEADVLEHLAQSGWISKRDGMVVLSRHSAKSLQYHWSHPWVQIASINRHYFGASWQDAMNQACERGNADACVPSKTVSASKVVLLLPLSGQLAPSAKSFRQGFMTAMIHSGDGQISVETLDVSTMSDARIRQSLQDLKPDWVIGPMGRGKIADYIKMNLPYKTMILGDCDGSVRSGSYCFSLAATGEIPSMVARLQGMGVRQVFMLNGESSWHQHWGESFMRSWPGNIKSYALSDQDVWVNSMMSDQTRREDSAGHEKAVDAVIFNMSLSDMKSTAKVWKTYQLESRVMLAPSIGGPGMRGLGVSYFDSRLMLSQKDDYLAPSWLALSGYLSEASGPGKRFSAWGEDAFSLLSSGRLQGSDKAYRDVPLECASGMVYVDHQSVVRMLDLSASYWEKS